MVKLVGTKFGYQLVRVKHISWPSWLKLGWMSNFLYLGKLLVTNSLSGTVKGVFCSPIIWEA